MKTNTIRRPDYSRNIETICWETEGCFKNSLTLQDQGKLRFPEKENKHILIEAYTRKRMEVLGYDNYNKDADRNTIINATGRFYYS